MPRNVRGPRPRVHTNTLICSDVCVRSHPLNNGGPLCLYCYRYVLNGAWMWGCPQDYHVRMQVDLHGDDDLAYLGVSDPDQGG